jgi:hypothetical protein
MQVRELPRRSKYAASMTNQGKVDRVLREAVAVLVEELGQYDAAELLETTVAQLRGVTARPQRTTRPRNARKRNRRAVDGSVD